MSAPSLIELGYQKRGLSLYIHVPYCVSKCAYCDFYSAVAPCAADIDRYVKALLAQVAAWGAHYRQPIRSVYFGGGTPSLLGARIGAVLDGVRSAFDVATDAEITLEVNPDSIDATSLVQWLDAGVNRISMGVQSFDEGILRWLGRRHDVAGAAAACALLREAGVDFSVDLICGIPGLSDELWLASLESAIKSGASHVSVYSLTIEEGTPLADALDSGEFVMPDDDVVAQQMNIAADVLGAAGIKRYEVANYARPGHKSVHNTGYWTGVSYLGFGPSAASMLTDDAGNRYRFILHDSTQEYFANPAIASGEPEEVLSPAEALREDVMLGLRLVLGVSDALVGEAGVRYVMEDLAEQGLVEFDSGTQHWRTTAQGWLLGNVVFAAVWCA